MAKRYCRATLPVTAKMPNTHVTPIMQKKLALTLALKAHSQRERKKGGNNEGGGRLAACVCLGKSPMGSTCRWAYNDNPAIECTDSLALDLTALVVGCLFSLPRFALLASPPPPHPPHERSASFIPANKHGATFAVRVLKADSNYGSKDTHKRRNIQGHHNSQRTDKAPDGAVLPAQPAHCLRVISTKQKPEAWARYNTHRAEMS